MARSVSEIDLISSQKSPRKKVAAHANNWEIRKCCINVDEYPTCEMLFCGKLSRVHVTPNGDSEKTNLKKINAI